jgi:hypothetical protein
MPLRELPFACPDGPNDAVVEAWHRAARERIELYWDSFASRPLPQYVECDFEMVAAAIETCLQHDLVDGRLFLEWGCGFGVVTGSASLLGMEAVGIEAEEFLCQEARCLLEAHQIVAEVWHGNFLPDRAEQLAEETDPVVSLGHRLPPVYDLHEMHIDDFALVFAYPWPGEEHFLKQVFHRFARRDALLLLYRGPNQIELYRKC